MELVQKIVMDFIYVVSTYVRVYARRSVEARSSMCRLKRQGDADFATGKGGENSSDEKFLCIACTEPAVRAHVLAIYRGSWRGQSGNECAYCSVQEDERKGRL